MRSKYKWIYALLLAITIQFSFAQDRTIKGVVSDAKGPLSGANIVVKNTKTSASTDFDGSYSIKAKTGDVLVFSFIGMDDLSRTVGASNTINMLMRPADAQLVEVVVTGQGIKKSKKALGYAVTTIKAEDFASKPSTDVVRALTGKAPGVNIAQTSGLSGSGTNIIIRGYSSITGSNQPLFVVDGIPFNADTNSDGNFVEGSTNASSRFLDLDPNNIESISILKGLSATTLYGSAGRSGVILVTTKSGKTDKVNSKFGVNFSQSLFMTNISSLPDYQDNYGNGFDNSYGPFFSNWGPKFGTKGTQGIDVNGQVVHPYSIYGPDIFPQYFNLDSSGNVQPKLVDYKSYNNIKPFFRTGYVNTTSINIGGSSDKTSFNLNVGNSRDEGFIENNNYSRLNLSAGGSTKLDNGFTISAVMNYVKTDKSAPPTGAGLGSGSAPSVFANIFYTPRSIDLFGWEYENPIDKSSVYYRVNGDIPNPRWTLKNSSDDEAVRRFFGNITAMYQLNSWSNLSYRLSLDNYTQRKKFYLNKGNGQSGDNDGFLNTSVRENFVSDHTLSYNFDVKLSNTNNWNLDGTLGFNPRLQSSTALFTSSTLQLIYGLNEHGNFTKSEASSSLSSSNLIGTYGSVTVGYKKYAYLNFAGRNETFSSLQPGLRSLFYPSASISFIPTDAFEFLKNSSYVNYVKLRVGYGSSAGFPDPYQTVLGLGVNSNAFVTNDGQIIDAIAPTPRRQLANLKLKPELTKELEFGLEAKLLKNRVGIDLSLYDKRSTNLIIDRLLDPSVGYNVIADNIAEVSNRGIELGLNFSILKSKTNGFNWSNSIQFTRNLNIVESLGGAEKIRIAGFTNLGNFAIPGKPYGVMLGSSITRDVNGNYLVGGNGNYIANDNLDVNQNPNAIIGDPNADWRSTFTNEFSFRGITLGFQLEFQKGGDIASSTASSLISRGSTKDTDFDRSATFVLPGVDQFGNINTTQIGATQYGFNNSGFFIREQSVYDATNLRLREASLSYSLPKKYLDKTPFGKISISIIAQNYWFKAFNFPKYLNFDPEVMSLGVGNGQGFDYLTGPSAKRIGFNFNLSF